MTQAHPSKAQRRLLTAAGGVGVLALAGGAFVLSFDTLRALAVLGGASRDYAYLYPCMLDGLVVVVICSILMSRRFRWWSRAIRWLLLLALVTGAGAAGVDDAVQGYGHLPRTWVSGGVAAAPWVILLLALWLWVSMIKQARAMRGDEPRPEIPGETALIPGLPEEPDHPDEPHPLPPPLALPELGPAPTGPTRTDPTPAQLSPPQVIPAEPTLDADDPTEPVPAQPRPAPVVPAEPAREAELAPAAERPEEPAPAVEPSADQLEPARMDERPEEPAPRVAEAGHATDGTAAEPLDVRAPTLLPTDVPLVGPSLNDTQPDGVKMPDTRPDGLPLLRPAEDAGPEEPPGPPSGMFRSSPRPPRD